MPNDNVLLYAISPYRYMLENLAQYPGNEIAPFTRKNFGDGETYQRFDSNVRGRHVVLIGSTEDAYIATLIDQASAAVMYGAESLTVVLPFFAYSTMERANPDMFEVVTAKSRARQLSAIPIARGGTRFLMFDLHANIHHYFEGSSLREHIHCESVNLRAIRVIDDDGNCIMSSTDGGRVAWVKRIADVLKKKMAIVLKHREDGETTERLAVYGDVAGKHVVLFDDMVRRGTSAISAAEGLYDAGASRVSVVFTHGVFVPGALENLLTLKRPGSSEWLFDRIVTTDTHYRAAEAAFQYNNSPPKLDPSIGGNLEVFGIMPGRRFNVVSAASVINGAIHRDPNLRRAV